MQCKLDSGGVHVLFDELPEIAFRHRSRLDMAAVVANNLSSAQPLPDAERCRAD
jgi:hypothetical protein